MRSVLALALCVLLIASPAMAGVTATAATAGTVKFLAAARDAARRIQLCSPDDRAYRAGEAAAREYFRRSGIRADPPAESLARVAEDDRYCWELGWRGEAARQQVEQTESSGASASSQGSGGQAGSSRSSRRSSSGMGFWGTVAAWSLLGLVAWAAYERYQYCQENPGECDA